MDALASAVGGHIVRADAPWVEQSPETAIKVLWASRENGSFVAMFRWKAGYVASRHKHTAGAHVYCIQGRMKHNSDEVMNNDGVMNPGDWVHEPSGTIHEATTAIDDNVHMVVFLGPVVRIDADGNPLSYFDAEKAQALMR